MPNNSNFSNSKQKWQGQALALTLPSLLNLLDYRIYHVDRSVDPARREYNEHPIFVFWHEYISVVLPRWGHTPLTVLCSQHRDGEIVNQTAASLGLHVVRGSSNRGGSEAIRLLKANSQFSSIAITPDGPRGPRREMALGPVYLASLLRMPIVPVGVGISNPWRLNTWDRFAVPKPNSKVRLIFGPKIYVNRSKDRDHLETHRAGIEKLLNNLTDQAEAWSESGLKMEGEQPFVRDRHSNRKVFTNSSSSLPADEDRTLLPMKRRIA